MYCIYVRRSQILIFLRSVSFYTCQKLAVSVHMVQQSTPGWRKTDARVFIPHTQGLEYGTSEYKFSELLRYQTKIQNTPLLLSLSNAATFPENWLP